MILKYFIDYLQGTIADYVSPTPPMIPSLIIHCLNEIELRGMNEVGLYRVPGSDREVKELMQKFLKSKNIPRLVNIADKSASLNMMYEIVSGLPQPNKDTLAFLMLHLQRVAENPQCKMPAENLSKVFGPTIVGYSTEDPSESKLWNETEYQTRAVHLLLQISSDYWQNLLNIEPDVIVNKYTTPDRIAGSSYTGSINENLTYI
ncbi:rac GTPase-activating protein 1-like [Uloborus diversus]|uniref:rac GTPase-activating protein 1-like n=1 Tax=Uloborus diversus TaxID=327109 RepID=UPI002409474B|nr:rac GTPase-activating protein 1-like [Uloborus diversus]